MSKVLEPKTQASIITRPCIDAEGNFYPRFVGALYVQGRLIFESSQDFDSETEPIVDVANAITRYYKEHGTSLIKDALAHKLKKIV